MMPLWKFAVAASAAAIAALLAGSVCADERPPLTQLSPDGSAACFGRVYDAAHLKAHPHQKVSRIFFLYGHDPVSHPNEEPGSVQSDPFENGFMATTVRGAKKPEWVGGSCSSASEDGTSGDIHCGMECDRTMANLKLDAKGSLIVSDVQRDLYLDAGSDEELSKAEYEKEALGTEDDGFRLDRMPVATCTAEFARIDPVDPAIGAPLRERLKPDQPFCYGRDYTDAHLASHPDQVTQSIRVFRGPVELASFAAGGDAQSWPDGADIAVSLTTRQKSGKVTQTYTCEGEGDQWRCSASAKPDDFSCDVREKEIYLKRAANGVLMVANPNSSLPIVDMCSKAAAGDTKSDDKVFRLDPMPQSACAP